MGGFNSLIGTSFFELQNHPLLESNSLIRSMITHKTVSNLWLLKLLTFPAGGEQFISDLLFCWLTGYLELIRAEIG
jgi:hypothetical protein